MAQPRQFKVSLVDIFIIIASLVMFAVLNWKNTACVEVIPIQITKKAREFIPWPFYWRLNWL